MKNTIWLVGLLGLLACWNLDNGPKNSIYVLPKGYIGPVIVIFNDTSAGSDSLVYATDFKLFNIDSTGVHRTRHSITYKPHIVRYYMKNDTGYDTLQLIPTEAYLDRAKRRERFIYNPVPGKLYRDNKQVEYILFSVCTRENIDSVNIQRDKLEHRAFLNRPQNKPTK